MDSTELQSDSLEAKGRDELITIATALGGKPASRARKAEIVELILDLASGGTSSSTSKTEESETETTASDQEANTTKDQEEPPADWEVAPNNENEVEAEIKDDAFSQDDDYSQSMSNNLEKRSNEFTEPGNRRRRRRGRPDGQDDSWDGEAVSIEGYLDLRNEGYGFLRTTGFRPSKQDAYVSVKQVKQLDLRRGD